MKGFKINKLCEKDQLYVRKANAAYMRNYQRKRKVAKQNKPNYEKSDKSIDSVQ